MGVCLSFNGVFFAFNGMFFAFSFNGLFLAFNGFCFVLLEFRIKIAAKVLHRNDEHSILIKELDKDEKNKFAWKWLEEYIDLKVRDIVLD